MTDFKAEDTNVEMPTGVPSMQYPQLDNYPIPPNPQSYQQPLPNYGAHQYPHIEPQVVVQKQPQRVIVSNSSDGSNGFIGCSFAFSVVCLILSILFCACPLLVFTIPALVFSSKSKDKQSKGEFEIARSYSRWACGLNILAVIIFIAAVVVLAATVGSVEFRVGSSSSSSSS